MPMKSPLFLQMNLNNAADESDLHSETAVTPEETTTTNDNIRVCIMNEGFTSEKHQNISITSDVILHLTFKDRTVQYPAGEIIDLTADDFTQNGDSAELSAENDQAITVLSLNRNCGHPSYCGHLRIIRTEEMLYLINIISLEDYLKGVVPSEMPASYHSEALKAQAVCARSYAISALQNPKYDFADLNDSTSCQVYMNQVTDGSTVI